MSGFETRDDWPESSWPIFEAVFEQPRSRFNRWTLDEWLAPWGSNAAGERVSAGALDSDGHVLAQAAIDYEKRQFRYRWQSPEAGRGAEGGAGLSLAPPVIPTIVGDAQSPLVGHLLTDEGREVLKSKASFVWSLMTDELFDRIRDRQAAVYARVRSPLEATIVAIPPDVWAHFEVEDWANGVAFCASTGERLFSARVELLGNVERGLTAISEFSAEAARREAAGEAPFTRDAAEQWASGRGLGTRYGRELWGQLPESQRLKPGQKKSDYRKGGQAS